MSGKITQFVDFSTPANDTGDNDPTAIQPYTNGEDINQTVLQRPPENLRVRTEVIKNIEADSLFLRDADRSLIIAGPGKVTWPGSTTATASGIPVFTDTLYILPMLTPGFAQSAPVPPVASAFGTLHLKRASDSMNSILVTSQRRSYAAGDQINVQVFSGASFSCALDTDATFQRTIKIIATGSTQLSTVISALTGLTPGAPDNTALVTAALEGGASGTDLLLTTQAKQFVSGNYDGEGHAITPANVASFFSSNPTQALAEGDTLCANFPMVTDTGSTGGRRQAIPENTNTAITAGAYFNSRVHPENLPNALPICKVVNNTLVFSTGASIPPGSVAIGLNAVAATDVEYGGGGTWADGTTNPATTVEAQLDKIISDLASTPAGSAKIAGAAVGTYLANATLASQIATMANFVHADKAPTEASIVPLRQFEDWQGNARSLIDHNGYRMGQVSELDEHWTGVPVTVSIPLFDAFPASGTWAYAAGGWQCTVTGGLLLSLDQKIPAGSIITSIVFSYERATTGDTTGFAMQTGLTGTATTLVTKTISSGTGLASTDMMVSPTTGNGPQQMGFAVGAAQTSTILEILATVSSSLALFGVEITYTPPPPGWTYSGLTTGTLVNGDVFNLVAPDAHINHRSVQLVSTASSSPLPSVAGVSSLVRNDEIWLSVDTAFEMEFPVRTGTITDGANAAQFDIGLVGSSKDILLRYVGGVANWQLVTIIGTSGTITDTGIAVVANTVYRIKFEVYGVNRNSTGQTRVVIYVNGTKVAEDATRTFTDGVWHPSLTAQSTATPSGPYDFRVGRVHRVWNHYAASDAL